MCCIEQMKYSDEDIFNIKIQSSKVSTFTTNLNNNTKLLVLIIFQILRNIY